jgi:predicted O-methyltransferase YrrM
MCSDGAGNGLWQEVESEGSLPPSYFQPIYERSDDPWNFQTSGYESGKYNETLASLPRAQYRNALEIGCSIGVLTAKLATRCSHLLSLDVSEQAINQA